jgi:cyclic pyranopterin phosphate synthase
MGVQVRFIEFMPLDAEGGWSRDLVVSADETVAAIHAVYPLEGFDHAVEPATRYRYVDGAGEIGVISSVTQAFCSTCNRMRLSTEGSLFTCLFAQSGHDLKSLVRGGASDEDIRNEIAAVWQKRDDRYSEIRTEATSRERKVEMSYIGG